MIDNSNQNEPERVFKSPEEAPKMARLAEECMSGACNVFALVKAFGRDIDEIGFFEARYHPAVKVVMGQLSYLCGDSSGPSKNSIEEWEAWKKQNAKT